MRIVTALALATTFALAVPAATWAQGADEAAMVQAADTPEEHQALADHYRSKAEKARKKVSHHQAMAKHYGGTKLRNMQKHCNELAALNEREAAEYEQLAAAHEAAAKP